MYLFIASSISTDLDLLWALCQKQLSSSGGGAMVTQEHQLWTAPGAPKGSSGDGEAHALYLCLLSQLFSGMAA